MPRSAPGSSDAETQFFYQIIENALRKPCGDPDVPLGDLVRQLQWTELDSGQCLYTQGEPGNSMHILVSGRLRVSQRSTSGIVPLSTLMAGECVGEIALLSEQNRTASVHATRKSLLVELTRSQFEAFSTRHPELLL